MNTEQTWIEVESLGTWWGALYGSAWDHQYHPLWGWPEHAAQWEDLYAGLKYLKTADGREWWVPVSGWMGDDWSGGEMDPPRGSDSLQGFVMHHVIDAGHDTIWEIGGGYCPMMLFDRHTNDPGRVFCMQCGQFVSLCVVGR